MLPNGWHLEALSCKNWLKLHDSSLWSITWKTLEVPWSLFAMNSQIKAFLVCLWYLGILRVHEVAVWPRLTQHYTLMVQ